MRDLYDVLGVAKTASPDDLKKAYRTLAKLYHPDKCPDDKAAEEKFKEAANAYQILSDPAQRSTYDRYGIDGLRRGGGGGGDDMGYGGGFHNVEDIFSAFGDLFGDFFGAASRGRAVARGQDLRLDLELSFREAVWGAKKDVKLTRHAACSTCNGAGSARGKVEICRQCNGRGQITHSQGYFMVQSACTPCRGSGKLIKDPCPDCRGRGLQPESTTLTVGVPAGVDDGQSLRLAGKGETAASGMSGDLYVVLRVASDPRFVREGNDVTSVVSISYAQAVLGSEVEIDTIDEGCEGTAILELAPGTQLGETIVRRGQGIPHHDRQGRGDHYVEFKIEIPRKLTSKQAKLLREFDAELGEESKPRRRSR